MHGPWTLIPTKPPISLIFMSTREQKKVRNSTLIVNETEFYQHQIKSPAVNTRILNGSKNNNVDCMFNCSCPCPLKYLKIAIRIKVSAVLLKPTFFISTPLGEIFSKYHWASALFRHNSSIFFLTEKYSKLRPSFVSTTSHMLTFNR